jgi:hypothetical protein
MGEHVDAPVPFDNGGILHSGLVLPANTLRPEVRLSPEQTRAFERCAEIVRWQEENGA